MHKIHSDFDHCHQVFIICLVLLLCIGVVDSIGEVSSVI
jgi:hypothetical protein